MKLRWVALAVVCASTVAFATAAQASSIVYIRDYNVWIANPDGSNRSQVTANGTRFRPWYSPSQADNGTILAVRERTFHRMDQGGNRIGKPLTPPGAVNAELSPDGRNIAYAYTVSDGTSGTVKISATPSDRFTQSIDFAGLDPAWLGNDRFVFSQAGDPQTHLLGTSGYQQWWSDEDHAFEDPGGVFDVDVSERKVVGVRPSSVSVQRLQFYRRSDNSYSSAPGPTCEVTGGQVDDDGLYRYTDPTWSPDGGAVAWASGDGIYVAAVGDDVCPSSPSLVLPGAEEPHWGPADVNPPATLRSLSVPTTHRIATLLRRGLRFRATCAGACSVAAELRVGRRRIGTGRANLPSGGTRSLTLRLNRTGARLLRGRRRVSATLRVAGVNPNDNGNVISRRLTLRR